MSRIPLNDLLKIAPLDTLVGSEELETTSQIVTGAVNELKDAIDDLETENDAWTAASQVVQSGSNKIVVFDNLDDTCGYALYCKDAALSIRDIGFAVGTNPGTKKLTYYLCDNAATGTYCKLRILK